MRSNLRWPRNLLAAAGFCLLLLFTYTNHAQTPKGAGVPLREYYNRDLAAKWLLPDAEGHDDPRFSSRRNYTSIIDLICNRDKYHGKPVRFEGFLQIEFEGNAVYLSRESRDFGVTKNGIWIDIREEDWKASGTNPKTFSEKHVLIEGVFDSEFKGHLGAFSGSIHDVWSVQEVPPRRNRE